MDRFASDLLTQFKGKTINYNITQRAWTYVFTMTQLTVKDLSGPKVNKFEQVPDTNKIHIQLG